MDIVLSVGNIIIDKTNNSCLSTAKIEQPNDYLVGLLFLIFSFPHNNYNHCQTY